ncbi:MAG: type II toxin-antitoxin system HicA family toxin [Gemmatimonadetes bacterium]|nr:type II toxin-antitoxin system HicA family toxin [Gemmatimonadota bacterium]
MKKRDLIRELKNMGCVFVRHGSKHDWYKNPETNKGCPVPRHNEIKEGTARHIIKILSS